MSQLRIILTFSFGFLIYGLIFFLFSKDDIVDKAFVLSGIFGFFLMLAFVISRIFERRVKRDESGQWLKVSYLGIFMKIVLTLILVVLCFLFFREEVFSTAIFLSFLYLILTLLDIFLITISGQKV